MHPFLDDRKNCILKQSTLLNEHTDEKYILKKERLLPMRTVSILDLYRVDSGNIFDHS